MSPASARRFLHAGSALVLLLLLVEPTPLAMRAVLAAGAVLALFLESIRLTNSGFRALITRLVPVFREGESKRLSGATWLAIGYALAAWFPAPAVIAGILTGALADPAASWAGTKYGSGSTGKTWVGSGAAAVIAALALFAIGLTWIAVAAGALAATTLERWPRPFNDNLVIAPGVALVVWLIV